MTPPPRALAALLALQLACAACSALVQLPAEAKTGVAAAIEWRRGTATAPAEATLCHKDRIPVWSPATYRIQQAGRAGVQAGARQDQAARPPQRSAACR